MKVRVLLKRAVALVAQCCSESWNCFGCMSDCICGERLDSFDGDKASINVYCTSMKALVERKRKAFQLSHSRRHQSRKLGLCPGTACIQWKDYFLSSSSLDMNHFGLLHNAVSVPGTGHPRVIKLSRSISSVWQGTNMSGSVLMMEHVPLIIRTTAYFHWSLLNFYRNFIFHSQYSQPESPLIYHIKISATISLITLK